MGVQCDDLQQAFPTNLVQKWINGARVASDHVRAKHVFLAIDPNAGGLSAFSIVSIVSSQGATLVSYATQCELITFRTKSTSLSLKSKYCCAYLETTRDVVYTLPGNTQFGASL